MSSAPSALSELFSVLEARSDTNLGKYFTATPAVGELAKWNGKSLGIGFKGIGKTATFRYLTEYNRSPDLILGISDETHSVQLPPTGFRYSVCKNLFELDIAVDVLRSVVEEKKRLAAKGGKLLGQEVLLEDSRKLVASYTEMIKKGLGRIGGFSIMGFGLSLAKAEGTVETGLRRKNSTEARRLLKNLCDAGFKIRVVVDDPENVFSASQELDTHLVGGFCLAAINLNQLSPNFKIISLLKSHVWGPCMSEVEDMTKYPDESIQMAWDKDLLKQLVLQRLRYFQSNSKFTELFDEASETNAVRQLEYMISSVRNGPRDLLYWISSALSRARREGRAKIAARDIKESRREVSLRSLKEIESAYFSRCPGLIQVLRLIFRERPKFNLRGLKKHIESLITNDKEFQKLGRLDWMQSETSDTIPRILFEAGALVWEEGNDLCLPYSAGYTFEAFEAARQISVSPLLGDALQQGSSGASNKSARC